MISRIWRSAVCLIAIVIVGGCGLNRTNEIRSETERADVVIRCTVEPQGEKLAFRVISVWKGHDRLKTYVSDGYLIVRSSIEQTNSVPTEALFISNTTNETMQSGGRVGDTIHYFFDDNTAHFVEDLSPALLDLLQNELDYQKETETSKQ